MPIVRTNILTVLAIGSLYILVQPAYAQHQSEIELHYQMVETERQAIITATLPLTDTEATTFWPLYSEYRRDVKKTEQRRLELLELFSKNVESLSRQDTEHLTSSAAEIDVDRQKLKRKYFSRFAKSLSGAKLFRYYQIETKLEAIHRVKWTQKVPLASIENDGDEMYFGLEQQVRRD